MSVAQRQIFDPDCKRCARLSRFLGEVRTAHPDYHCGPVAPFGDPQARLLIVGLAPGKHGANASGRPFTGDYAGILLYETLHRHGFSSAATSQSATDGLKLHNCRISNAVKCLPPENKPLGEEINNCNGFLAAEIDAVARPAVVLALGAIAHNAVLKSRSKRLSHYRFRHGATHALEQDLTLLDSYHCSRYNTQTRRLTPEMFDAVFKKLKRLLG
ncbi:MAG: uracil-DNA glycosylase [Gammaproteobacteria bacterium]